MVPELASAFPLLAHTMLTALRLQFFIFTLPILWSIFGLCALYTYALISWGECTRTGRPGRVWTPNQLVRSGFDHWFPVTPELIAVMVCDQSIIRHYIQIIGIIAKYHIYCIVQRNKQAIVGISLVPLRSEPGWNSVIHFESSVTRVKLESFTQPPTVDRSLCCYIFFFFQQWPVYSSEQYSIYGTWL